MTILKPSQDSVIVLYKGGRLPEWEDLTQAQKDAYSQEHVDLMLSVAREHGLMRLEGFKLLTAQQDWRFFWVIEFPTLAGAEAWIDAEMQPPYGRYGFYEYYLARKWAPDYFDTWVPNPRPPTPPSTNDPHQIPKLAVDTSSVVAVLFGRYLPAGLDATAEERGDQEHIDLMQGIARKHKMMRLQGFKLIGPQANWHRAWLIEFPTLAGAEAWLAGEVAPPHGRYATKSFHLARRWAPDYFTSWIGGGNPQS